MAVTVQAMPSITQSSSPVAAPVFGHDKIFGVSAKRFPVSKPTKRCTMETMISLRGGQVLEPESLDDVEAILIKAGSEGKLVVIDFSATWYVRWLIKMLKE
jgi:hypothetical protein